MNLEAFFAKLTLIVLVFLRKTIKAEDYLASLPADGCPTGYQRINNGCYKFMNDTAATWNDANSSCYGVNGVSNDTNPSFNNSISHLISFESSAEQIAIFFWLKGFAYFSNFYTDGIFDMNSDIFRYWSWSGNPWVAYGYFNETYTGKSRMHLYLNSSKSYALTDSAGTAIWSYICEAQVPCSESQNVCQNGNCYVNAGRAVCKCFPGYYGILCEQEYDNCLSVPCLHGATCNNQPNNYSCTCTLYYEGRNCEIALSYKYDKARTTILAIFIGVVGLILFCLSLMDLPWIPVIKFIKDKIKKMSDTKNNKNAISEKEKRAMAALSGAVLGTEKKIKKQDLLLLEKQMIKRFKLALIQTKNQSPTILSSNDTNSDPSSSNSSMNDRLVSSASPESNDLEMASVERIENTNNYRVLSPTDAFDSPTIINTTPNSITSPTSASISQVQTSVPLSGKEKRNLPEVA